MVRGGWGLDLEKYGTVRAELTVKPVQEAVKLFGGGCPGGGGRSGGIAGGGGWLSRA